MGIATAIDSFVSLFSPERGLKRTLAREVLKERKYAAAKVDRLTGGWFPVDKDVNELIQESSPIVRARVRQLVRDFPYFKRARTVLVNFTVGEGINFQSRVKTDGKLNKKLNQQVEDAYCFATEAKQIDFSCKLDINDFANLEKKQICECGEAVFIKRYPKEPGRYIPYSLQAIEPDRLTNDYSRVEKGNDVSQGIEYSTETGKVAAYHIQNNGYSAKVSRVLAEHVIHTFETDRPGQLRGISPFTSAVLLANDLGALMDATLDRAKLAAKWLAFIKTPSIHDFQKGRGGVQTPQYKRIEELENGIIEYLNAGEEIELSSSNQPGDQFSPYVSLLLHMLAVGVNVPYELVSGDYSGLNYSVLRGIRNDFMVDLAPQIKRSVKQFYNPVKTDIVDMSVLTGRLTIPSYYTNPFQYQKSLWIPPGLPPIDPLKEGKADTQGLGDLLRSPLEIIASKGRDPEQVLDEFAEWERMKKERGLVTIKNSTASANNPAALDKEK